MSRDHIFVRCEECRNHGRCKRERTAFRHYHVKGCFVEVKKEAAA